MTHLQKIENEVIRTIKSGQFGVQINRKSKVVKHKCLQTIAKYFPYLQDVKIEDNDGGFFITADHIRTYLPQLRNNDNEVYIKNPLRVGDIVSPMYQTNTYQKPLYAIVGKTDRRITVKRLKAVGIERLKGGTLIPSDTLSIYDNTEKRINLKKQVGAFFELYEDLYQKVGRIEF